MYQLPPGYQSAPFNPQGGSTPAMTASQGGGGSQNIMSLLMALLGGGGGLLQNSQKPAAAKPVQPWNEQVPGSLGGNSGPFAQNAQGGGQMGGLLPLLTMLLGMGQGQKTQASPLGSPKPWSEQIPANVQAMPMNRGEMQRGRSASGYSRGMPSGGSSIY